MPSTAEPDIAIRRIRPGDAGLLRAVRTRSLATDPDSFGSTHADVANRAHDFWADWVRRHAAGDDGCTLLAVRAGQPVGIVRIDREADEPGVFGVYSMWVAPEVRRRGVGLQLLAAAEEWIRSVGGREARLNVVESELPATRLYERAGYRLDGRSEPSPNVDARELGMSKPVCGDPC